MDPRLYVSKTVRIALSVGKIIVDPADVYRLERHRTLRAEGRGILVPAEHGGVLRTNEDGSVESGDHVLWRSMESPPQGHTHGCRPSASKKVSGLPER